MKLKSSSHHVNKYLPLASHRIGLGIWQMGAAAIGDMIYVAGGGPIMGGDIQSALHEAFTLE